jgi:hypothetical protein
MLLFFWTGAKQYKPNFRYTVRISAKPNFVGHTCGFVIEIPQSILSKDRMYRQLINSITDQGFGLA